MAYPFLRKLASSSTPGYAAFILHHQDSAIAPVIVRIDSSSLGSALADEALKRLGVRVANHSGAHCVGRAILGSDDDGLADATTARA